jgi:hypothetical protein
MVDKLCGGSLLATAAATATTPARAPSLPVLPPVIITVLPVAAIMVALRLLGNLARLTADRVLDCSMVQG